MARISRIFVSLAPIYIFSKLCGFADFYIDSNGRFTFSDKLFIGSCAYHTLMVCVLFYVIGATRDNIFGHPSTTLIMFNASGLTLMFIVDKICQKFYEKKKITPLWKNLGGIQRKMAALNMELEYGKISLQSALSFVPTQVILTCLVATQYYISYTLSPSKITALMFSSILYVIESERTVITGQYCSFLIVIRNMFETITRKLDNIKPSENPQTTFRFLAIFHQELCKVTRKTNKLYNAHLVLSFSVDFLCFVTYTQMVVYDFLEGHMTNAGSLSLVWIMVLCSRIIPIVTISHSCVDAVCGIRRALAKLWIHSDMFIVKKEINLFNLQITHEEFKIMAGDMFLIERSLLLSILGAVATYMIITIQLDSHFTVLMLRFK